MASYYDEKKKKYVVTDEGQKKEFESKPSLLDQFKEAFEPTNTRAQLDAIRRKRMGNNG